MLDEATYILVTPSAFLIHSFLILFFVGIGSWLVDGVMILCSSTECSPTIDIPYLIRTPPCF